MKEIILSIAADCERDDCRISFLGTTVTVAPAGNVFDKNGDLVQVESGPAIQNFVCRTCGRGWSDTSEKLAARKNDRLVDQSPKG